ncbi:hypothetical protein LL962_00080 [Xanthomonas sp. NCPPB 1067]|uniref:hypothetical protein n=1 Tax=Xanthomonas sp. NCPPB 1067 TaxID=487524 RepID=UPI001E3977AC|nr:hypothetical protein [Xanthomonas sp. NCPPB 1067]MCC4585523.1 hypothetical protein [Xanthomonas sp. NCPPB 1067]
MLVIDRASADWLLLREGNRDWLDIHCAMSVTGFSLLLPLNATKLIDVLAEAHDAPQDLRRRLEIASRHAKKAVVSPHVRDSVAHSFTAWSVTMAAWKQTSTVSAMVAGLLVCNAAWADHVDLRSVRDYPAGAPAIAQIHGWLLQQSRASDQPRQVPPPATPAGLGAVRVSRVSFDNPLGTRTDAASDAVPLPARGRPRDEIAIDACNAGQRYRWVYTWQHAKRPAWHLRAYRQQTVADCKTFPELPIAFGTDTDS